MRMLTVMALARLCGCTFFFFFFFFLGGGGGGGTGALGRSQKVKYHLILNNFKSISMIFIPLTEMVGRTECT